MKNFSRENLKPITKTEIFQFISKINLSTNPKQALVSLRAGTKYSKSIMRNNQQFSDQIQSEKLEQSLKLNQNTLLKLPLLASLKYQKSPNSKDIAQVEKIQKKKEFKSKDYGLTEEEKQIYGDRIVGTYQKIDLLGKGGFALVWLCSHSLNNQFAIKQIAKPNISGNSMIHREIRFFKHFFSKEQKDLTFEEGYSNLIEILSIEQGQKDIWIIQELGGKPLSKSLYTLKGEFFKGERVYAITNTELTQEFYKKPQLFIKLLENTLKGIKLMFDEGFTHCDLKPENILVEYINQEIKSVKIIDYGSSFLLTDDDNLGMVTPEYMAPEVLEIIQNWGKLSIDYKSQIGALRANCEKCVVDIWSFGAIILDMIMGIPHWLSYKGKIERNGKSIIKLGLFACKGRELDKIIQKQIQLIKQIEGIVEENALFLSPLKRQQLAQMLKKIFQINPQLRIQPNELIQDDFFLFN